MNTKKVLMIILLIVVVGVIGIALVNANNKSIGSTTQNGANNGKMIEITDNFFIEQTNDIYLNVNDYIGKTIKIEGLIYSYEGENGEKCYAVVRNTPGVTGFIGSSGGGAKPFPVKQDEIEKILRRIGQSDKNIEVDFGVGDSVKILSGPFSGMEGKVESMNDQSQVATVLIILFGRETPTDISYLDLSKSEF